jgi:predicted trehalose synthase
MDAEHPRSQGLLMIDGKKRAVADHVGPQVDCSRFLIKRAAGETAVVVAHAFCDGHDLTQAQMLYRKQEHSEWQREHAGTTGVAVLLQLLPNQGDAWSFTLDNIDRSFSDALALKSKLPV